MGLNLKRLNEIAKQPSMKELEEAEFRDRNREWLKKSALIALEIRRFLRLNGKSQTQLAEMLEVSPAMVTKLLSGKENLSLKTICNIEQVIGVDLLNVSTYKRRSYVTCEIYDPIETEHGYQGDIRTKVKFISINADASINRKNVA